MTNKQKAAVKERKCKGPAPGWRTLSAVTKSHCSPQHPLDSWLEYLLSTAPALHRKKSKTKHSLMQISYA